MLLFFFFSGVEFDGVEFVTLIQNKLIRLDAPTKSSVKL